MYNTWLVIASITFVGCLWNSQLSESSSKSCPTECICLSQTQVSTPAVRNSLHNNHQQQQHNNNNTQHDRAMVLCLQQQHKLCCSLFKIKIEWTTFSYELENCNARHKNVNKITLMTVTSANPKYQKVGQGENGAERLKQNRKTNICCSRRK